MSARPIHANMQGKQLCLWAPHNDNNVEVMWDVYSIGTGNPAEDRRGRELPMYAYIDTVHDGPFVWHVFAMEAPR